MSAWTPYQPDAQHPWDQRRVVHLHRRCVFGASWQDFQRDVNEEPQAAVTRILNGTCRVAGTPDDFEELSELIGQAAIGSASPDRLKAWWVFRMLFTPDPLTERLTLMWHNHFATSNLKVDNLAQMKNQNEVFRKHGCGPFAELLRAALHDAALLRWLDAPSNRKGHPNENLAREVMELFTLGIGNYSETDVAEAARALTGLTVRKDHSFESPAAHDDGSKTILGKTGTWQANDLVDILLDHPATAQRLAWRLTDEFFGEGVVDDEARMDLADGLRKHDLDLRWGVETILRSQRFFSDENIASRVCDPVTFLLAPLRAIESWRQPPSTLVLAEWLDRFGQDLFYPPNVGGWNGGRSWLTTRGVIARAKYADALASGKVVSPPSPPDLSSVVPGSQHGVIPSVQLFATLLFGSVDEETVARVCKEATSEISAKANRPELNNALVKLLTDPRSHLH